MSKADLLRSFLANAVNASEENVDVFTVLRSPLHENETILDVRFSAHGSPYYEPERINAAIVKRQNDVSATARRVEKRPKLFAIFFTGFSPFSRSWKTY